VASAGAGGTIEVHLDSVTGPLACTLTVTNTGDWNHLVDVTAPLAGITGSHKLFLVFHGAGDYLLNVERLVLEPVPAETGWTGGRQLIFRGGCGVTGDRDPAAFQDAVDIAKGADVVVLVCGIDSSVDHEEHDRDDIKLTGAQPDLIQAVYAANPNTVLVLNSNNTLAVNWEQDNLPAILAAICAGQAQGTAIAEVLFGAYNPGGKLPCTWYRSLDQLPPSHDYDIHKGRTYMYLADTPLYPFGHGLSYTSFEIGDLHAAQKTIGPGGSAKYTVSVTNTGKVAGAEVVQLYVVPPASSVKRPLRQLSAFQRVELAAGERKSVVFELPYTTQAFWYWDEGSKGFVCTPGDAQIEIGNSSAHLPIKAALTLKAGQTPTSAPDAVDTIAAKSYVA
jgi:beta-glucosidase